MQGVQNNRVVTAFTAENAATLTSAIAAMNGKGLWASVEGAAAIVDLTQGTVVHEPATQRIAFGPTQNLALSVSNWKVLAALTALFAIVFAGAFLRVLRTRAQRRRKQPDQ